MVKVVCGENEIHGGLQSDLTTKTRVAEMLGWGSLVHVLRDPDSLVQQHALGIVRNMMAGGTGNDVCRPSI